MANNHPRLPPASGHGRIPVLSTTLRREGLRSGGPPPEPATDTQTPRMFIRLPARPTNGVTPVAPNTARPSNRDTPVVPSTAGSPGRETHSTPNTARSETREAAPPSYTEQVEQEATGTPRIERSSTGDESVSERNPGSNREDSFIRKRGIQLFEVIQVYFD